MSPAATTVSLCVGRLNRGIVGRVGWGLVVMLLQGAVCLRLVAVPGLAYIRGRDLLTRQELTHEERGGQLGIALGAFALIVIVNIMTP